MFQNCSKSHSAWPSCSKTLRVFVCSPVKPAECLTHHVQLGLAVAFEHRRIRLSQHLRHKVVSNTTGTPRRLARGPLRHLDVWSADSLTPRLDSPTLGGTKRRRCPQPPCPREAQDACIHPRRIPIMDVSRAHFYHGLARPATAVAVPRRSARIAAGGRLPSCREAGRRRSRCPRRGRSRTGSSR